MICSVMSFCRGHTLAGTSELDQAKAKIYSEIVLGHYNQALQQLNISLKEPSLKSNQRYELLTIKSKIYFWEEKLVAFFSSATEAYKLKKNESPVYEAYYFAQKAHYFHYQMVGDSMVIYAEKALNTLRTNWKDRQKIEYFFIYQIFSSIYLYKSVLPKEHRFLTEHEFKLFRLENVINYLDSALLYVKECSHFPQDKAIIYRSKGNRIMDVVGYQIRTSDKDLEYPTFKIKMAHRAINSYSIGMSMLDNKELVLKTGLKSLKALAFYSINESKKGDHQIWPLITKYNSKNNASTAEKIAFLHGIQYFTQNLIARKKYDPRIKKVINVYIQLLPFWYWQILAENNRLNDTYGDSPATMLLLIHTWHESISKSNRQLNNIIPNLILSNYLYYSQTAKNKFQTTRKNNPNEQLIHFNEILNIHNFQKRLKDDEALIIKIKSSMLKVNYLLVTRNAFYKKSFETNADDNSKSFNTKSVSEFKKDAFLNYRRTPFYSLLNYKKFKTLYVAADIDENYDFMVTDLKGNSFDKLNFLKRKLNIIKLYNPIDFFSSTQNEENFIGRKIQPFYISRETIGKLPFTESIFKQKVAGLYYIEQMKIGTSHLLGHGELFTDKDLDQFASKIQKYNLNNWFSKNHKIYSDLLILNFCFSGYKRTTFLPDRDLHNYLISKGAKAVIASPYQTVDQSSAYIFEKFYTYLDQGITAEDALQKAKMDYLKTHKGSLAHPIYWSTYELTTNVKDLRMAPRPKPFPWEWIPIFTFLFGVGGAAWWSLRR